MAFILVGVSQRNSDKFEFRNFANIYCQVILFCSLLGVFQFLYQASGNMLVDFFAYLPESLLLQGYNTTYPLEYGGDLLKSNGYFFLEPSFFSQYLAFAIIVEKLFFNRLHYITVYFFGLFSAFSGTGLILLLIVAPWVFLKGRSLILTSLLIGIFAVMWINSPYADFVLNRIAETADESSSGYIRFIAPYKVMFSFLSEGSYMSILFGLGAGAVSMHDFGVEANFPVIPKVLIEYGVLVCSFFLFFMYRLFFVRAGVLLLSISAVLVYGVLSGSFLQPSTCFFVFAFGVANRKEMLKGLK